MYMINSTVQLTSDMSISHQKHLMVENDTSVNNFWWPPHFFEVIRLNLLGRLSTAIIVSSAPI